MERTKAPMTESQTLNSMNKKKAQVLHDEIKAAVDAIAKKHGLALSMGTATYSDTKLKLGLSLMAITANLPDGVQGVDPKYLETLKKWGFLYKLTEADYGKEYMLSGSSVRLMGMTSKQFVLYRKASGGLYRIEASIFVKVATPKA